MLPVQGSPTAQVHASAAHGCQFPPSLLQVLADHVHAAYASSCDAPLLWPAFVRRLNALLGEHDAVVPRQSDRRHPLSGVYRTALGTSAEALLGKGHRRLIDLLDTGPTRLVPVEDLRDVDPDPDSLRKVNTRVDYEGMFATLAGAHPGS